MFEVLFELGVESVNSGQAFNFDGSSVYFPAENTKTKHAHTSYLTKGMMNELRSMLKQKSIISKRGDHIQKSDAYLFHHGRRWNKHYTEN